MLFKKRTSNDLNLLETLRAFSKEINSIVSLKELLKNLLRHFVEIAHAQTGSFWMLEKDIKALVVRESIGGDPLILQFSTKDPFLNYLGQTSRVVTQEFLVKNPALIDVKEAGLNFMTSVNAGVVFPMMVDNHFIGILALGNRRNKELYSTEELDLLSVLVAMGTISIHNAILYDSMAKQNLKLSEIAKLKTQFVSTITHELSTPLNGILGLAEILNNPDTSGPLNDDQRRYVQMIRSAAEELSDMVNQILDLTRFQSQKGALEVKRVDLAATVEDIRRELQEICREKGIDLRIDLGPRINVYGDEGQIRQVIQCLLENAVKFSQGNGSQMIGIHAGRHGDMLKICIFDHGIGIREQDQEIIFDEFRQLEADINRSYGGTGLGLALAKKIVELHGGRIWVESKKGEGSQFYFTLPLKPGLIQAPEIETQRQ